MKTVLNFPGESSAATVFTRKPKITCLPRQAKPRGGPAPERTPSPPGNGGEGRGEERCLGKRPRSVNLAAADVSPLHPPLGKVTADPSRLLPFRGSRREGLIRGNLSPTLSPLVPRGERENQAFEKLRLGEEPGGAAMRTRRSASGRFKLGVRFYESPGASLEVKILNPEAPAAAPENQADEK
jgi:hypothetical protein